MLRTCPSCSGFLPPRGSTCPHCGQHCREADAMVGEATRRATRRQRLLRGLLPSAAGGAVSVTLMACYGLPPCEPDCGSGGGGTGGGGQGGASSSSASSSSASSSSASGQDGGGG